MKKIVWASVAVLAFMVLAGYLHRGAFPPKQETKLLFQNPQNLAEKVANAVYQKGEPQAFNVGSDDEGIGYNYKLYVSYRIYDLELSLRKNGRNGLHINYYATNRPVENLKNAADLVARELMYGKATIAIEEHVSDYKIDMVVDIYQTFTKKRGSVFMGFTREERDWGITNPSKSGVQEYLFDGGRERQISGWKKASAETLQELQEAYKKHLKDVSTHLNIK